MLFSNKVAMIILFNFFFKQCALSLNGLKCFYLEHVLFFSVSQETDYKVAFSLHANMQIRIKDYELFIHCVTPFSFQNIHTMNFKNLQNFPKNYTTTVAAQKEYRRCIRIWIFLAAHNGNFRPNIIKN